MILAKVKIQNFRNLKDVTVNLSKGLNVILGENNVGKTNLLDAIRAALGAASNTTSNPVRLRPDDLHRNMDGLTSSNKISVSLFFSDLSENEKAEFLEILDYDQVNPEHSSASIHYEWSWDIVTERWSQKRWGGDRPNTESAVPEENLQSLPTTMLGALRDATNALVPGRMSRLAKLLMATAKPEQKSAIEEIMQGANSQLEDDLLINTVQTKISSVLGNTTGDLFKKDVLIRSSDQQFDKIVQGLRIVLKISSGTNGNYQELVGNGLGYNNIVYISTILAELEASKNSTLPLLFIEEPEAHLHPQLQMLLAEYLSDQHDNSRVQTIITSHSPTIASNVDPEAIRVLHDLGASEKKCTQIICSGLDKKKKRKIQRMFDITKATLLFSRGAIVVEGISEALLIPVLAERYGKSLRHKGISIIPICGVDFETICELFKDGCLDFPVAILTDSDPKILSNGKGWKFDSPEKIDGVFDTSDRVLKLKETFTSHQNVKVFCSAVTLEFDLSAAGTSNPKIMRAAFQNCFIGTSSTLTDEMVTQGNLEDKSLNVWRAVCRSSTTLGKGDFSHQLTDMLAEKNDENNYTIEDFIIPQYIKDAIDHVIPGEE